MPNRATHEMVGVAVGVAHAAYRAKELKEAAFIAEMIGGGLGGYWGGKLPDILEPALSSWHRGAAHSAIIGGLVVGARNGLAVWEAMCREKAANCRALRMVPAAPGANSYVAAQPDWLSQLLSVLGEFFWHVLAALLNGLASGYVSHLALDALTPRSIPLLP